VKNLQAEAPPSPVLDDNAFLLDVVVPAAAVPHDLHIVYTPRKQRRVPTTPTPTPAPTPTRIHSTTARRSSSPPPSGSQRPLTIPASQATAARHRSPPPAPSQRRGPAPLALVLNPAHVRPLMHGDEKYAVPLATRLAHPPRFVPAYPPGKGWYVVGRGYDFGVFYDHWYVFSLSTRSSVDFLLRYRVSSLVERLKGHGALFKKCPDEAAALAAFERWDNEGRTGVLTGPR
jgi:hypothetical protein